MELTLIQTLQFNLFVPSMLEFAHAFITRLVAGCSALVAAEDIDESLLFEPMHAWTTQYFAYLESDFAFIERRQSEKAEVVVQCALARWSIMCVLYMTDFPFS